MESKTKAQKSFLIRIPISHEEVKFMSDLIVLLSMLMASQSRLSQRFLLPFMQKGLCPNHMRQNYGWNTVRMQRIWQMPVNMNQCWAVLRMRDS
jgi:hypothetical protein